jgi:protein gp37
MPDLMLFQRALLSPGKGPDHRPLDPSWITAIRDDCVSAGVPFFFKQWGGRTPKAGGRELDGRKWDQMPRHPRISAA